MENMEKRPRKADSRTCIALFYLKGEVGGGIRNKGHIRHWELPSAMNIRCGIIVKTGEGH